MSGKIFYRERSKIKEEMHTPRFRVIAVSDVNLKIYADHFRKQELEQLAKATNAELIELKVYKHVKEKDQV